MESRGRGTSAIRLARYSGPKLTGGKGSRKRDFPIRHELERLKERAIWTMETLETVQQNGGKEKQMANQQSDDDMDKPITKLFPGNMSKRVLLDGDTSSDETVIGKGAKNSEEFESPEQGEQRGAS